MTPYRIALVCLGNICRSPVAEVVLAAHLAEVGLDTDVAVESAGTAGYHVGKPMDARASAALARAGYDPDGHRARQFTAEWFERLDVVLAMDSGNLADLQALARRTGATTPLLLFGSFDPDAGDDLDVPDPYYGDADGFDETVAVVARTCARIVTILRQRGTL